MEYTIKRRVDGDFEAVVGETIDALDSIASEVGDRFERVLSAVVDEAGAAAEA
jgi:hypothetical protein